MKASRKSIGTDMGAIEQARSHAKIKSASVEVTNNQLNIRPSSSGHYDTYDDLRCSSIEPDQESSANESASFHDREGKFLTPSPAPLKPSVSTSCLLTDTTAIKQDSGAAGEGSQGSSNALVCIPTRASLTHEWKKLKTPNKCRECSLLVYFNGRECSFCGFVAHKKCVAVLVIKCSGQQLGVSCKGKRGKAGLLQLSSQQVQPQQPGQQNQPQSPRKVKLTIQPIFGQPIGLDSHQVIDFIRRFIYEIDTRGLTSKGIYRVSSIKSKVDRLCNYYDQNLSSLVDLSSFHPNIIANALKMYLRQLPEPLLTHDLYNQFIDIAKKYPNTNPTSPKTPTSKPTNPDFKPQPARGSAVVPGAPTQTPPPRHRKPFSLTSISSSHACSVYNNPAYDPMLIVEMSEVIEMLPPINRELIAIIMRHLKRVANMSDENQMSATNLSIIFGPTLLSSENNSLAIVDNIHQARVVELMITWAYQVFPQYENYESKAVIELEIPPDSEYERQQQMARARHRLSSEDCSADAHKDYRDRGPSKCNCPHHKMKEALRVKNELDPEGEQSQQHIHPADTRRDLNEMRRQFFAVPSSPAANIQVQGGHKQNPPDLSKLEPRKPKFLQPPVGVPVNDIQ